MKAWFDRVILSLAREMRWSYLPPLMVYLAAGICYVALFVNLLRWNFFAIVLLAATGAALAALLLRDRPA